MAELSSEWNNEAYVSLHLVEEMLRMAGLPSRSSYSHWYPQYKIENLKGSKKWWVDFYIEDWSRYINFLIEVKSAKNPINDQARHQLYTYLHHSQIRFGLIIDPFLIEIYEYNKSRFNLKAKYEIKDPYQVKFIAQFLVRILELIKMRTISIHTSKGGVGKTTLVVNLAYELAKLGNRVLVIDLDDQANASLVLGVNKADEIDNALSLEAVEQILKEFAGRKEIIDFLKVDKTIGFNYKDYLLTSKFNQYLNHISGKIDVIPGSYRTKDNEIGNTPYRQELLNKGLQNIANDYDYVIIDTPPSYTDITWNGVMAAQYMVIPSQMEYLSAYGINNPIKQVKPVEQNTNGKRGKIIGIAPMMTKDTNLNKTIKELVKHRFYPIPILTEIQNSTYVGEALKDRQPMSVYADYTGKGKNIALQFLNLTQEIVATIDKIEAVV
jgi:chromosome partitioning protein